LIATMVKLVSLERQEHAAELDWLRMSGMAELLEGVW